MRVTHTCAVCVRGVCVRSVITDHWSACDIKDVAIKPHLHITCTQDIQGGITWENEKHVGRNVNVKSRGGGCGKESLQVKNLREKKSHVKNKRGK